MYYTHVEINDILNTRAFFNYFRHITFVSYLLIFNIFSEIIFKYLELDHILLSCSLLYDEIRLACS